MKTSYPRNLVIAVDGPSSSGKSSFAKAIAREMNYLYIDSGAMYRAVTLYALQNGFVDGGLLNEAGLMRSLGLIEIGFIKTPGGQHTVLNGREVEKEIRGMEVSEMVSPVSRIREVRQKMVKLQREMGKGKGIVMDGRDIGTVVFPGADIKIFLVSRQEIRADRRHRELVGKGLQVDFSEVMKNISERDRIDQSRTESPLRQAEDAVLLDNSNMTPEEQMKWFRNLIENRYHAGEH